jgi:hypothetical protein
LSQFLHQRTIDTRYEIQINCAIQLKRGQNVLFGPCWCAYLFSTIFSNSFDICFSWSDEINRWCIRNRLPFSVNLNIPIQSTINVLKWGFFHQHVQSYSFVSQSSNIHQWWNYITTILIVNQYFPLVVEISRTYRWAYFKTINFVDSVDLSEKIKLLLVFVKVNIFPRCWVCFSRRFCILNVKIDNWPKNNSIEENYWSLKN